MSLLYKDKITSGKLFQCGAKEIPSLLKKHSISLLILAAKEFQPEYLFNSVDKIYVPLIDSIRLSKSELRKTFKIADKVAEHAVDRILNGENVLSTCMAGWNRSGLISGLAIYKLTGTSGKDIVRSIRRNRSIFALSNPLFAKYIVSAAS